jgi:hypothetical protein
MLWNLKIFTLKSILDLNNTGFDTDFKTIEIIEGKKVYSIVRGFLKFCYFDIEMLKLFPQYGAQLNKQ